MYFRNFAPVKYNTVDLIKVAGTYDIVTSTNDVLIEEIALYVITAGVGFTSVSIQTNQTNATEILSAADGAVANIVIQKNIPTTLARYPFVLRNGQKIQYTLIGDGTAGSIYMITSWRPITGGSKLT